MGQILWMRMSRYHKKCELTANDGARISMSWGNLRASLVLFLPRASRCLRGSIGW